MSVVKAIELWKYYDGFAAVKGIDFEIKKGEVYGFLGPNGAGKTTTVKMITCFFPPSQGQLEVFGLDVRTQKRKIKRKIGVAPQEMNLDPDFTVEKNLLVYSRYFGFAPQEVIPKIDELLFMLKLQEKQREVIDHLSGGLKKRLLIARAMINAPELLVLDEPTTGLDPQARHFIWEKIREIKRGGITSILTTHYMEEAQYLCDRVAIMHQGKIIEEGNPKELIRKHVGRKVVEAEVNEEEREKTMKWAESFPHEFHRDRVFIYLQNDEIPEIKIDHFVVREANLEDVFLKLTGRELIGP